MCGTRSHATPPPPTPHPHPPPPSVVPLPCLAAPAPVLHPSCTPPCINSIKNCAKLTPLLQPPPPPCTTATPPTRACVCGGPTLSTAGRRFTPPMLSFLLVLFCPPRDPLQHNFRRKGEPGQGRAQERDDAAEGRGAAASCGGWVQRGGTGAVARAGRQGESMQAGGKQWCRGTWLDTCAGQSAVHFLCGAGTSERRRQSRFCAVPPPVQLT